VRQAEMTTAQWKAIITCLCGMGVTSFAFTGGEPLERNDLAEIVSHAAICQTEHIELIEGALVSRHAAPALYLLSNGRAVDETVLTMCQRHGVQLSLSLPGLETFEQHTGFDDADKVLQSFTEAKHHGLNTVANITVTKLNLDELGARDLCRVTGRCGSNSPESISPRWPRASFCGNVGIVSNRNRANAGYC